MKLLGLPRKVLLLGIFTKIFRDHNQVSILVQESMISNYTMPNECHALCYINSIKCPETALRMLVCESFDNLGVQNSCQFSNIYKHKLSQKHNKDFQ